MDSKHEEDELRIVLLGKTGVGKSSAGNIILERDRFHTDLSPSSVTTKCQKEIRDFNGQTLAIVDTPGLFHTDKSVEEVVTEIVDCITSISPGPHVFLLVFSLDDFSDEDNETLEIFQKIFKDAKRYTIVLFTHGDQCERGCDAFIKSKKDLKRFIEESCETHHVFNKEVEDESQVNGLLQKIDHMVQKNRRRCYSNDLFRQAVTAFKEVMQRPEVKSASDPTQAAEDFMLKIRPEWISKIEDAIGEDAKWAYKGVTWYLNILNKVVYELMPAGAKE